MKGFRIRRAQLDGLWSFVRNNEHLMFLKCNLCNNLHMSTLFQSDTTNIK